MKIHIYKLVKEILKNPELYHQCIACKNPVDKRHAQDGCPTCGGHYFEAEKDKDFSHLKDILEDNQEIEV
jgi:predicted  nucleic acid-binding Zn-ribbon protein